MRKQTAITKNVRRYQGAVRAQMIRSMGVEGGVIVYGYSGEGKSLATDYVFDQTDGVCLRAEAYWTMTGMLQALAAEVKVPVTRSAKPMADGIKKFFNEHPRPLFIDELDRLFAEGREREGQECLETLRGIYDYAKMPFVLIGEETSAIQIQKNGPMARRITQQIEFDGIDIADARTTADTICEVPVADDLLQALFVAAQKNIGRMVVGLTKIEEFGKASSLDLVDLTAWGERGFFFDQPVFKKRKRLA